MTFEEFVEWLRRSPAIPRFYARVPDDHVLDDAYEPTMFQPDEAYFLLTL
jgi:hypothetical protein